MPESNIFWFSQICYPIDSFQIVVVEKEESAHALTASALTVPVRTVLMGLTSEKYYQDWIQSDNWNRIMYKYNSNVIEIA